MKYQKIKTYFEIGEVFVFSMCGDYIAHEVVKAYDKPNGVTVVNYGRSGVDDLPQNAQVIFIKKLDQKYPEWFKELEPTCLVIDLDPDSLIHTQEWIDRQEIYDELLIELASLLPANNAVRMKVDQSVQAYSQLK